VVALMGFTGDQNNFPVHHRQMKTERKKYTRENGESKI